MERYNYLFLLNVLLSLFEATDLAGPDFVDPQLRTACIGWKLSKRPDLDL
jgi:hypothetical protein